MRLEIVAADAEMARWLAWVSAPSRASRWQARGETWEVMDGEWVTRRMVPDPHEMVRDGRTPDLVLDAWEVTAADRLKPSQGDIDDALKGLPQVEVRTAKGETRIDYPEVPLTNADGTPNRYAKNLMDLHAPAARKGDEVSREVSAKIDKLKAEAE